MKHDLSLGNPGELAALYAAGAMPADERSRFEDHLNAGCPDCRCEVAALAPAVSALADLVPTVAPPPALRATLLQRTAEERRKRPDEGETAPVAVVARASEAVWKNSGVPGVQVRTLFLDRAGNRFTGLLRMAPGSSYPAHIHRGPEECLVLEGELCVGPVTLRVGDYQRHPAGTRHVVQTSPTGCLVLITSSLADAMA